MHSPRPAGGALRVKSRIPMLSFLFLERWLTVFVGHLLADLDDLSAHLEHDLLDAAPDRKITTRRTPRRQAGQGGQG
jgi:hypothetical protein